MNTSSKLHNSSNDDYINFIILYINSEPEKLKQVLDVYPNKKININIFKNDNIESLKFKDFKLDIYESYYDMINSKKRFNSIFIMNTKSLNMIDISFMSIINDVNDLTLYVYDNNKFSITSVTDFLNNNTKLYFIKKSNLIQELILNTEFNLKMFEYFENIYNDIKSIKIDDYSYKLFLDKIIKLYLKVNIKNKNKIYESIKSLLTLYDLKNLTYNTNKNEFYNLLLNNEINNYTDNQINIIKDNLLKNSIIYFENKKIKDFPLLVLYNNLKNFNFFNDSDNIYKDVFNNNNLIKFQDNINKYYDNDKSKESIVITEKLNLIIKLTKNYLDFFNKKINIVYPYEEYRDYNYEEDNINYLHNINNFEFNKIFLQNNEYLIKYLTNKNYDDKNKLIYTRSNYFFKKYVDEIIDKEIINKKEFDEEFMLNIDYANYFNEVFEKEKENIKVNKKELDALYNELDELDQIRDIDKQDAKTKTYFNFIKEKFEENYDYIRNKLKINKFKLKKNQTVDDIAVSNISGGAFNIFNLYKYFNKKNNSNSSNDNNILNISTNYVIINSIIESEKDIYNTLDFLDTMLIIISKLDVKDDFKNKYKSLYKIFNDEIFLGQFSVDLLLKLINNYSLSDKYKKNNTIIEFLNEFKNLFNTYLLLIIKNEIDNNSNNKDKFKYTEHNELYESYVNNYKINDLQINLICYVTQFINKQYDNNTSIHEFLFNNPDIYIKNDFNLLPSIKYNDIEFDNKKMNIYYYEDKNVNNIYKYETLNLNNFYKKPNRANSGESFGTSYSNTNSSSEFFNTTNRRNNSVINIPLGTQLSNTSTKINNTIQQKITPDSSFSSIIPGTPINHVLNNTTSLNTTEIPLETQPSNTSTKINNTIQQQKITSDSSFSSIIPGTPINHVLNNTVSQIISRDESIASTGTNLITNEIPKDLNSKTSQIKMQQSKTSPDSSFIIPETPTNKTKNGIIETFENAEENQGQQTIPESSFVTVSETTNKQTQFKRTDSGTSTDANIINKKNSEIEPQTPTSVKQKNDIGDNQNPNIVEGIIDEKEKDNNNNIGIIHEVNSINNNLSINNRSINNSSVPEQNNSFPYTNSANSANSAISGISSVPEHNSSFNHNNIPQKVLDPHTSEQSNTNNKQRLEKLQKAFGPNKENQTGGNINDLKHKLFENKVKNEDQLKNIINNYCIDNLFSETLIINKDSKIIYLIKNLKYISDDKINSALIKLKNKIIELIGSDYEFFYYNIIKKLINLSNFKKLDLNNINKEFINFINLNKTTIVEWRIAEEQEKKNKSKEKNHFSKIIDIFNNITSKTAKKKEENNEYDNLNIYLDFFYLKDGDNKILFDWINVNRTKIKNLNIQGTTDIKNYQNLFKYDEKKFIEFKNKFIVNEGQKGGINLNKPKRKLNEMKNFITRNKDTYNFEDYFKKKYTKEELNIIKEIFFDDKELYNSYQRIQLINDFDRIKIYNIENIINNLDYIMKNNNPKLNIFYGGNKLNKNMENIVLSLKNLIFRNGEKLVSLDSDYKNIVDIPNDTGVTIDGNWMIFKKFIFKDIPDFIKDISKLEEQTIQNNEEPINPRNIKGPVISDKYPEVIVQENPLNRSNTEKTEFYNTIEEQPIINKKENKAFIKEEKLPQFNAPRYLTTTPQEGILKKYENDVEIFADYINKKNAKWKNEIITMINNQKEDINKKYNILVSKSYKPGQEKLIKTQMYKTYNRIINIVNNKAQINFNQVKSFFIKESKKKIFELLKSNKEVNAINKIEIISDTFYKDLGDILRKYLDLSSPSALLLDDEDRETLNSKYESLMMNLLRLNDKLKSFYTLNYNIMDIILDNQFMLLYVIKLFRILFTYIGLFLTTKIFTPMYENAVYDSRQTPPSLWQYLFIFVLFDLSFNGFLVILLFLMKFLFKTQDNNFIVDKYLFYKYLTDYFVSILVLLILGYVISTVITDKKYFKYKYEGDRAIRAYQDMLFKSSIVVYLLPYFLII